jgi:hypothetical protein
MHDCVGRQLVDHQPHDIDVALQAVGTKAQANELPCVGDVARL